MMPRSLDDGLKCVGENAVKHNRSIGALMASVLILSSAAGFAQGKPREPGPRDRPQIERGPQADRDRDIDRDRLRDRLDDPSQDRDRDRTHVADFSRLKDRDIYGSEIMSMQERNEYRRQLQDAASAEERRQIETRHRETVRAKAQSQGVDVIPPGRGIYGGALMSVEERSQFREQLRMFDSDEERLKFMAKHREEMQVRARLKGVILNEAEEGE